MNNDRFKFRVWDIENKCWVEDIFIDRHGNLYKIDWDFEREAYLHYNDYIVMQCTGLKDRDDKLIYKDDIVKYNDMYSENSENGKEFDNFENIGIIEYNDKECMFDVSNRELERECYFELPEFEVIGNKYENNIEELIKNT